MIKRIAALSILLVYLTVTAGFTMSAHFCGGQVTKVSISTKKLFCGEKEMEMRCCHNKHVDVKVSDKHQSVTNTIDLKVSVQTLPFSHQALLNIPLTAVKDNPSNYTRPPLASAVPLTIANSIFRI